MLCLGGGPNPEPGWLQQTFLSRVSQRPFSRSLSARLPFRKIRGPCLELNICPSGPFECTPARSCSSGWPSAASVCSSLPVRFTTSGLRDWRLRWVTTDPEVHATLPGGERLPIYAGEATQWLPFTPLQTKSGRLARIAADSRAAHFWKTPFGRDMPEGKRLVPWKPRAPEKPSGSAIQRNSTARERGFPLSYR